MELNQAHMRGHKCRQFWVVEVSNIISLNCVACHLKKTQPNKKPESLQRGINNSYNTCKLFHEWFCGLHSWNLCWLTCNFGTNSSPCFLCMGYINFLLFMKGLISNCVLDGNMFFNEAMEIHYIADESM